MKKTFRIFFALFLVFVCITGMTACRRVIEDPVIVDEFEEEVEEIVPEPAPPVVKGELSDTVDENFQILLDDVVYSFPCSFSDFTDNGWVMDAGSAGASLAANHVTSVDFTKGDSTISLQVLNATSEAKDYLDCSCIGLTLDKWHFKNMTLSIPGGFEFGASADDILAAYGEPTEKITLSDGYIGSLVYGANKEYTIGFSDGNFLSVRIYVK